MSFLNQHDIGDNMRGRMKKKSYRTQHHEVTDWSGCGTRSNYIRTIVSMGLNVDGTRPEKTDSEVDADEQKN